MSSVFSSVGFPDHHELSKPAIFCIYSNKSSSLCLIKAHLLTYSRIHATCTITKISGDTTCIVKAMPVTKQYLRFEHSATFGVVSGRKANVLLLSTTRESKRRQLIVAPVAEDVILWDPRRGDKVYTCKLSDIYLT